MKAVICSMLLTICLGLGFAGAAVADDKETVNAFYSRLVEVLKQPQFMRKTAEMVRKDRGTAEKCLVAAQARADAAGDKGKAYRMICEHLEEALYLAMKGPSCNEKVIDRLTARLGTKTSDQQQLTVDDKIFVLENILRLCPSKESALRVRLADCYFFECQFGMAIDSYNKALKIREDEDVRGKLQLAQNYAAKYASSRPLSKEEFQEFITKMKGMGVAGTRIKLEHKSAIQTNRILFDEWSHQIKQEALQDLKEVGEGVRKGFAQEPRKILLIEGHTDRRGPREKLMVLSEQRAEAVRNYLAKEFGVDPSRLRTSGHGPDKPFSPRDDKVGWDQNRRVEFRIMDNSEAQ